ncbi:MAG TPA: O-antigen ligase family protein [Terriglobales bacterium]|nr:O-antigen ligase family protein [Terriglobales bacterium]
MPADSIHVSQAAAAIAGPVKNPNTLGRRIAAVLDGAIFACLCFIAALAPHNVHWPFVAFQIALGLWALRSLSGKKFEAQPFIWPSLIFLALAAVATRLSYAPTLSWDRLGWFMLLLLAVVVAQNVSSVKQVKLLILILLASATVSVARTGWQYVHGIGTELVTIAPDTTLYHRGLRSGDIIQAINGHATRTPQQWSDALKATQADKTLAVRFARDAPLQIYTWEVDGNDFRQWLSRPDARVQRGRPPRAQGHFYHYIPYAGMLLQIGLLTFGLLASSWKEASRTRWVLIMVFLGTAAALLATVTRTYMAALLLGSAFMVWLMYKKIRTTALVALALSFILGTVWIQHQRQMGWFAPADAGSEYRWLMWKDAPRLIAQHPVFGVGPDSEFMYGEQWKLAAYEKFPLRSHFHSTFIELAVDCGLPCLAAWVWLMLAYLLFLGRHWKQAEHWDWAPRGIFLGIFGGAMAFMMSSFIQYTQGDAEVMLLVWLFMGIAIALVRISGRSAKPPEKAA